MTVALRPLRGALACWQVLLLLALQLSDGSGAHNCPAHDHAAPSGLHGAHHGPAPAQANTHQGPCTCLGACHGAALAGAPSRAVQLTTIIPARAAAYAPRPAAPPRVAPRLLPFSVGPPSPA